MKELGMDNEIIVFNFIFLYVLYIKILNYVFIWYNGLCKIVGVFMFKIGCHLSISGGFLQAAKKIISLQTF